MGKGSNTTTTVQQVPPQVLANYQQAFNTAATAAQAPYQPYTGQIVADLAPGQNYAIQNYMAPTLAYENAQPGIGSYTAANNDISSGLNTLGNIQEPLYQSHNALYTAANTYDAAGNVINAAQPYINESNQYIGGASPTIATGLGTIAGAQPMVGTAANTIAGASGNYGLSQQELLNSTAPIWNQTMQYSPQAINSYYSPYVNDVVNATQAQFNNQNAIQQEQVIGNAAAEGAWGGDRSAVAQGIVAGQQQTAQAPVIAGLENTGFTQAQQQFNAQQQAQLGALETTGWLTSQAGTGLAGLGTAQVGQGTAQLGAAQTQQGIGQAQLSGAQSQLAQAQQAAGLAGTQAGVGQAMAGIGAGQVGIAGAEQGIAGQQIAAAGQAGNLAGQQTNANNAQVNYATQLYNAELGAINAGMSTGALQQAEQQAQLNVPYQIYTAGQAYPFQTSQFLTSAAEGLNPGGGTSTTTAPAPSPISGVGGLLSGIAGIAGVISDERAKEDIQQIGKASPEHGGGAIYSFRYKGDPTTHIGQMAQEVEKRRPDAVHEDESGLKHVDYRAATEARKIGGRIDPAHGEMPMAVPHGIKPSLGLGPRHKMRLAQGGEVLPSGIVGWRQGEQKFQTGGSPQSIIPGLVIPGMTGSMASPISPVLPSTKIPDLTISIVPPPGQGGHAGFGPPPPPTVQPGSAASSSLSQIAAAMPALGSAASMAKNWFNQGTSTFNNTGWMSPNAANAPFNNAAATGLYTDPAATEPVQPLFARGGRAYDDGGATPDTMADALALDEQLPGRHPPAGIDLSPRPASDLSDMGVPPVGTRMYVPGVAGFQQAPAEDPNHAANAAVLARQAQSGIADYIRQGAINRGIDPNAALHTVATEGGTSGFKIGDSGSSGGPFQLHLDDPTNPGAGKSLGDAFYRDTGLNPLDAKNWQAGVDYSLDYAKQHGFDPNVWHGLRQDRAQPVQLASADGAQVYAIPDTPSAGIAGMPTGSKLIEQTAEGKPSGLDALRAKGVDPWLALAIAGFATAAGRSPFPMQNIGAGFLEGAKYIQAQTAAYPEQQLKRAQAGLYQTEADLYKAQIGYDPDKGVGGLDSRISGVASQINKEPSPKDTAQPLAPLPSAPGTTPTTQPAMGPTGAPAAGAAPAPQTVQTTTLPGGSVVPVPAPGYDAFDKLYAQLDAQKRNIMNGPYLYAQKVQQVNQLNTQMRDLIGRDPRYAAQTAAATAAATSPIETAKAIATKQGESNIAVQQKQRELALENASTAEKGQVSADQEHISKELLPAAQKASENIGTSQLIHDTMQTGVATGFGANWKLEAGRVLTALGATPDQVKAFTGTNVPAGQELEKLFLQQSAGAVRAMGAREPGSVISLFKNAYPNLETDPRAIELMQNVLYMQGKQAQDHYNLARSSMDSSVAAMQGGQHYKPLSMVERDFTTEGGPRSPDMYLRAAQVMSGDVKGWAGTTKDQRKQILSLIPPGHQVVNQKGDMGYAPMPGTPPQ